MNILYFLGALVIFGLIVSIHEFGHFVAARLLKIPVLEFAIGMGPKVFSREKDGTIFSLRAIPLGGFCSFVGEDDGDYQSEGAFNNQRPWKRFLTILAGPVMNIVLAYLMIVLLLSAFGYITYVPEISAVTEGTPAQVAGVQPKDIVTAIDGVAIPFTSEGQQQLVQHIQASDPQAGVRLQLQRKGEQLDIHVFPQLQEDGQYRIGIETGRIVRSSLIQAMGQAWRPFWYYSTIMVVSLRDLIFKGEGLDQTMGPVGILSVVTEEIRRGWETVFNLILVISLNLGFMNLLPLPALDGGRLLFIAIEGIRRKPMKPELEGWVHATGFVVLIGLILVISFFDLKRIFGL